MKQFLKPLLPHLLVIIGFAMLSAAYMSPVFKGKTLFQSDPLASAAAGHEIQEFTKTTGEYTGWTNSMFSGMPSYFIGGANVSNGIFFKVESYFYGFLKGQGNYFFYYMLGIYILLMALECGLWTSILGAVAFAFFSYNIQIIEAGHVSKVYALAFTPILIAGLIMAFRGRIWAGAALFSLGLGLQINANHLQITYYTALILGIFGVFELVRAFQNKQIGSFAFAAVLSLVLGGAAIATQTARLWTTYEYTKETMRGGSEITNDKKPNNNGGLDRAYAFDWSQGKLESLTLLIPNFSGGASGGELNDKSEAYKALIRNGIPGDSAAQAVGSFPSYWGDQRFVGGGVYAGAILCFLFVLGLFFAENRYKYPFAIAALLCLIISWGRNFEIVNNFLFDYLPMFNKFRSVSMMVSLLQLCMIVVAALGLKTIFETKPSWATIKKPMFISAGLTAGLCLLFVLIAGMMSLKSPNDAAFIDNLSKQLGNNLSVANDIYNAIVDDRVSMLRSDAIRSLFFILLAVGLLWAFVSNKLKNAALVGGLLAALTLVDLWTVGKRYLNNDNFQTKYTTLDEVFQPSAASQQIMQDKDPNYRVFDVTGDPLNDARPAYFHKIIGGYHPAKLSRYQDLIEGQISKNNMAILNMLNTKYFIVADDKGQPTPQTNPEALGNAWFVREIKMVNNANEEMKALDKFDPKRTVVVDKRFEAELQNAKPSPDSSGSIRLTAYKPNNLTYESNSASPQVAVFSEIFYKGNKDWKSFVDGKEVPHFRANYVLRAMAVPAGKHSITFKFDPMTVTTGRQIDTWASWAWVLLVIGALVMDFRKK